MEIQQEDRFSLTQRSKRNFMMKVKDHPLMFLQELVKKYMSWAYKKYSTLPFLVRMLQCKQKYIHQLSFCFSAEVSR